MSDDGGDKIVGHKTFSDGPMSFRHEPLTKREADALWEAAEKAKADRAQRMPDERAAIRALWEAHQRLQELGWREAIYCPKDGTSFQVIEPGSTGIFECHYSGEWPKGSWWIADEGDLYPSHPILFKLYPEDQAKYDAKMAEARERYRAETSEA